MLTPRLRKAALNLSVLSLGVAGILTVTHMAIAQPPADAKYTGMKLCLGCHSVLNAELTKAFEPTGHPKAMQEASAEGAILANFDDDTPFLKEQVAYVLGGKSTHQFYLDKDLKILPGKWNINAKRWEPHAAGDGVAILGHYTTGFDPAKKTWNDMGVTCEGCHGPGSAHAATGKKETIGSNQTLSAAKQAMVCGTCHAAGTSKDGKYKFPAGYKWGDDLEKHFTLAEVKGPGYMQQYNEWAGSKHAPAGVSCSTCHEVHGKASSNPSQLKDTEYKLCMACHEPAVKKADHPEVPEGGKCSPCHMPQGMHTWVNPK